LEFRRPRESDKVSEHTGGESSSEILRPSNQQRTNRTRKKDSIAWMLYITKFRRPLFHPGSLKTLCVLAESLNNNGFPSCTSCSNSTWWTRQEASSFNMPVVNHFNRDMQAWVWASTRCSSKHPESDETECNTNLRFNQPRL
jgi:hypothetical protein